MRLFIAGLLLATSLAAFGANRPYQIGSCETLKAQRLELIAFAERVDRQTTSGRPPARKFPDVEKLQEGCRLDLNSFLPPAIQKRAVPGFGKQTLINCHGSTAYLGGLQNRLEAVTELPVHFSDLCTPLDVGAPTEAGDIGIIAGPKEETFHSFTYLTHDWILETPGMNHGGYPQIDPLKKTLETWVRQPRTNCPEGELTCKTQLRNYRCNFSRPNCYFEAAQVAHRKASNAQASCNCSADSNFQMNAKDVAAALSVCSESQREAQKLAAEISAKTAEVQNASLKEAAAIARADLPALSALLKKLRSAKGIERRDYELATFEAFRFSDAINLAAQKYGASFPSSELADLERGMVTRISGTSVSPPPPPAEANRSADVAFCLRAEVTPSLRDHRPRCEPLFKKF